MRTNALIPLQGQTPDIIGSMARGQEMAHRNALRPFEVQAAQQGIQQNALAMEGQRQNMDLAERRDIRAQATHDAQAVDQQRAAEIQAEAAEYLRVYQMDDRQGFEALNARYENPELIGQFDNPQVAELIQMLHQSPLDSWEQLAERARGSKASAAEQKIARIMESYHVDRRTAVGIVDGVMNVSRHPLDGSVVITDLSNNQVIEPTQTRSPNPVDLPDCTNSFEGTNPRAGVGARGAVTSLANTILDSVGLGQIAPNVDRAQTAMHSLATRTVQGLSAQWPGRPSNLTREMIDAMTVRPSDFGTGPGRALNKVSDMKREIERAVASAHRVATSQGQYSKRQIAEAQAALNDLLPLYQDYIDLEDGLTRNRSPQGQTQGGIKWSIEE